ncbi:uncharacterized protein M421DRAFT_56769 [Didymella exigua CBS 183.55]|uniref:AhpC-TSA-domain-containing protein n=1 Tax=Didymella exigua CBS 183.55 TaxID=1150837 RepID=A0A6A5S1F0_9PLEO|nr:uncharacterized protein M421DRAFT_56769 [Didymella exigua CBS 183.55]KAF1931337.1 hypothetical protein M421DRAFT_56769 [Didymella exigua CBS 183.55]
MASQELNKQDASGARTPPTSNELQEAFGIEVYDRDGERRPLGDIIRGKRSILIFTRHFWCLNCQVYVRIISEKIPPSILPADTQIFIISNGSYQPIDTYASTTSSVYPIYTDPTCQLHQILKFKSTLKEQGPGEETKDYMQGAGTAMGRIFGGIKVALGDIKNTPYIGPKAQNGGEVIIAADGTCEYMYRMQNTVDHTSVAELMRIIGATPAADAGTHSSVRTDLS